MSAIIPRLEMRQSQSLVMTQQLQQSIKLLQLSSIELAQFVEEELQKNPLLASEEPSEEDDLEKKNPQDDSEEGTRSTATSQDEGSTDEMPTQASDSGNEHTTSEQSEDYSTSGDDEYGNPEIRYKSSSLGIDDEGEGFESYTAKEVTLTEHLLSQWQVIADDPAMLLLGTHLIDMADESGYITDDLSALKEQLNCDDATIEHCFALLHTLDPVGVCARSVEECLAIQLKERNRLDPAMQVMLKHLELLAKGDVQGLSKLCAVDADDIRDMIAEVKALNPRPGAGFQPERVETVVPDVYLKRLPNGGWHVELNTNVLPRVLINKRYYAELNVKSRDKEEKKYLSDQLASASWLVKSLDNRAQTILKVSSEIVTKQDGFFRYGIRHLRPLTLKEVASSVEMHESTVSRVTTSKYIATPRGTFELKYFFSASIHNTYGGESYSNRTVQHWISEMIGAETESTILSDDEIAQKLQERGIEVARRTVAKYRDIMKIPSSTIRKRMKKAAI